MKKINAFYCIKTPSDWKESVLMYDKPTEKNKTKLTGFQLAGAVLAALLLVVGGALTLYRSGDEHKINVGMQQPSIDSSESLDSTELTADLEQAQNVLKQVVKDKEITAVGTYAGCGSDGTGYLFVDKIYVEKYTVKKGELIDYVTVNEYEYLKYHSYAAFKLDFRAKDVTTGKFAYMDELKVGEKIAVGINCDYLSNWNSDEIATGLGETVGGDSFGTDFYYSLRSSIAYAYDIDSSKDTGKEKLDKLILDSVQHIYEDMILQADDFNIVLNPVEKDWGFKINTLVNSVKHINYDADNYERDIIYPLIITPIQKGKAINVSTAGGSKEGIIIKVDGRYFSITSNYKDIVEQDDTNNEWYGSQSATVKNNRNYFFDENEWLVAIKFATGANTYFSDDLKLYINEVQNDITYSDKTDDSDCVITYHRFSETEVEVADKGQILDTDSKTE